MKIAMVVNPVASSVTKRGKVVIQKALSADHDLEVYETTAHGEGTAIAERAANGGAEVIVALGGDGTMNEVVNGVFGHDVAVAHLPGGSTNVFARSIGFPNEAVEATGVLLESLQANSIKPASVGMANGRAFMFHVGAGFDAAVVEKVEQKGPLKRYIGHPLFIASTLTTWMRGVDRKNPWFSVETSSGETISEAQFAVALNTNPYTYLGSRPLDLAPEATLSTDLSLIVLTKLSFRRLTPTIVRAIKASTGIPNSSTTRHLSNLGSVTIRGYRPFPYQLDGEFFDPVETLNLSSRKDAIKIVHPAGG